MLCLMALAPFIMALVMILIGKLFKSKIGFAVLPLPIALFALYASFIPEIAAGETVTFFTEWVPQLGINLSFGLDGLSLLFAMLITGIGALVVWYSIYYLAPKEKLVNFYVYLLMFMGAMLGVVTSRNILMIYLFWELTSVSSFLLIGYWFTNKRSVYGAQKSLMLTVAGGFCMLLAFIMIGLTAGSYEIDAIIAASAAIKASSLYPAIVILLLLGAFTKSAQIPFHIWLPDAMEAPTPISCYLHSATMVKAGIYLIARMTPVLGDTVLWFGIISAVGITSLVFGAYMAIKQNDLKGILAYSTVSQLGMIVAMLGFGSEAAICAALFHLFNHSVFKGSLFLTVGMVDHATGTRDIRKLSGLGKLMPAVAVICAFGALAMAGLPPFNGFLSKELFFDSALQTVSGNLSFLGGFAWIFPVFAVLGSIFTFVYSFAILFKVFFGEQSETVKHHFHTPSKGMIIPAMLLVSLTLIIAIFPNWFAENLLSPAAAAVTGTDIHMHIAFWHGFNAPLLMTLIVVGVGLVLFFKWDTLRTLFARSNGRISANRFYNWLIPDGAMANSAKKLTDFYMTGRLRDYTLLTALFFIVLVGGALLTFDPISLISFDDLASIEPFELIIACLIIIACFAIMASRWRLLGVLALGVVGYSVSLLFVLFGAPDLALTQLLVETVSLCLFFLAFKHLPSRLRVTKEKKSVKIGNIIVAVAGGVLVFFLTMIAHSNKIFDSIAYYYLENSKILAGGNNVVNVILVDFRGIDTMGEISVVGLAALGVYALISLGHRSDKKGGEDDV